MSSTSLLHLYIWGKQKNCFCAYDRLRCLICFNRWTLSLNHYHLCDVLSKKVPAECELDIKIMYPTQMKFNCSASIGKARCHYIPTLTIILQQRLEIVNNASTQIVSFAAYSMSIFCSLFTRSVPILYTFYVVMAKFKGFRSPFRLNTRYKTFIKRTFIFLQKLSCTINPSYT